MKKEMDELDYIGEQDPLTKEEEMALTNYFAEKKFRSQKQVTKKQTSALEKRQKATQ